MDKKSLIYKSAVKIIAKNGLEKTTMDEVAEKAKIAKGTIYYHFKSKDELFAGLIRWGVGMFLDNIRQSVTDEMSPKEQLLKIIDVQLDFYIKNKDICKVLISEFWRFESLCREELELIRNQYVDFICQIVKEGQVKGQFNKELNPEAASVSLFSLIAVSGLSWSILRQKDDLGAIDKTISTIFLSGITI